MTERMSVANLVEWLKQGLVFQFGDWTLSSQAGGVRWNYYFLDHPNGILYDESNIRTWEDTIEELSKMPADTLEPLFEKAHRSEMLYNWFNEDEATARIHAEFVVAIRHEREARRLQCYRSVLSELFGPDMLTMVAFLRKGLGASPQTSPEALEELLIRRLCEKTQIPA